MAGEHFIEHCPVPLETIPVLVTEEDGSQRMALLGEFLGCEVVEAEKEN